MRIAPTNIIKQIEEVGNKDRYNLVIMKNEWRVCCVETDVRVMYYDFTLHISPTTQTETHSGRMRVDISEKILQAIVEQTLALLVRRSRLEKK